MSNTLEPQRRAEHALALLVQINNQNTVHHPTFAEAQVEATLAVAGWLAVIAEHLAPQTMIREVSDVQSEAGN